MCRVALISVVMRCVALLCSVRCCGELACRDCVALLLHVLICVVRFGLDCPVLSCCVLCVCADLLLLLYVVLFGSALFRDVMC